MSDALNLGETIGAPVQKYSDVALPSTPSADVAALKRAWIEGTPGDSFRNWVESAPDDVFVQFTKRAKDWFIEDTKQSALKFIYSLRGGEKRYDEKVTMAEATASPAYAKLSDVERAAVKLLIESQREVTRR